MATKAHHRSRRSRRFRRIRKAVCGQWLPVLLSQTIARIVVLILVHWLHLPAGE